MGAGTTRTAKAGVPHQEKLMETSTRRATQLKFSAFNKLLQIENNFLRSKCGDSRLDFKLESNPCCKTGIQSPTKRRHLEPLDEGSVFTHLRVCLYTCRRKGS